MISSLPELLLSDHLAQALAHLNRARDQIRAGNVERHREAVLAEVTQAELSIARVVGMIAGAPQ